MVDCDAGEDEDEGVNDEVVNAEDELVLVVVLEL